MKTTKLLMILVMAICLTMCLPKVSQAASLGTAFTYQARLIDNNEPAMGIYDLQAKLFDSKDAGATQIGPTLTFEDGQAEDGGYFTIAFDFGVGVFDGDARYLELAFRPYDSNDPCDFVVLDPQIEITPTPYALYAVNTQGDSDWEVSGSDMYAIPSGNVGIGTTNADAKLKIETNSEQYGIEGRDDKSKAYLQCPDACRYTGGGTVTFEISKVG